MAVFNTQELNSWQANWQGVRVLVVGLDTAAFSAVDTLAQLQSQVLAVAYYENPQLAQLARVVGADFYCGSGHGLVTKAQDFRPEIIVVADYDLYVREFVEHKDKLAPAAVWSDTEFAWRVRDKNKKVAKWLVLSGESGKQETANLAALMLVAAGYKAAPVSKRTVPVLDVIRAPEEYDFYVVSLSAKDLCCTDSVAPVSSALVNTGESGGGAEAETVQQNFGQVYANTQIACVYNRTGTSSEKFLREADVAEGCRAVSVGLDTPPLAGLGLVEDILVDRGFHAERYSSALELGSLGQLAQVGLKTPAQVLNFLTAAALVRACDVPPEAVYAAVARVPELL